MVSVGIIHSLTGSMAVSESVLKDAALMAIAEINDGGGVLGEPVEAVIRDGASDPLEFAAQAIRLIHGSGVSTLFGCWTSSSRKAVLPVVEADNILLWYPLQYEGLECSPNIFYTGLCLNQQVAPAVDWLAGHVGNRFFLVGSDYVFPWTAHKLIKAQLRSLQGEVVGESYVPLGHQDFSSVIEEIQQQQPTVIFNTLNGDSNLAFYRQYAEAGLRSAQMPIMAVSIAEVELQLIGPAAHNHYVSWSYFQSLDSPSNQAFVHNFQRQYGPDRVTSDPIEAAYAQVYLWKQAVEKAQSFRSDRVREAAYGLSFAAPGGLIQLDENHHVWKPCRIGQVLESGRVQTVFETDLIRPLPWLGVEEQSFRHATVVTQVMSEVSDWIQKAHRLQMTLTELERSIEQREQVEAVLKDSQKALARAQAELEISQRLQTMLLPSVAELQSVPDLDITGLMEPAEKVGGDYYEVIQDDGKVYIGIGDVTGHGLESGVVMMIAQVAIRTLIQMQERDPIKLLNTVNRIVYDNTQRMEMERLMTLMLLEYENGAMRIYGQHEDLVIIRQSGRTQTVETLDLGFPLGVEPDISWLITVETLTLERGDVLVLYTDGITEAMNDQNEQYGLERLCHILRETHQQSASGIQQAVMADLREHIGSQTVFDDITLLVCKRP